jgi:maltose/maltodextrin transport system permease protein
MFKAHPVRHIIIIAFIIIVLFPILWIFMTSIRRDNSSISPNLFSGQTTWQNYVDLILETKNIPALYNEMANIYSLGSPYNKMTKDEIVNRLNADFKDYDGYFKSTSNMSNSVSESASWIAVNYLPKAKQMAINDVRDNSLQDITYISTLTSYLSKRFSSMDQNYKLAGLYGTLKIIQASSDERALSIAGEYFPDMIKTRAEYMKEQSSAASALANVPGEVSQILLKNGLADQNAKDLVNAYLETYTSLSNGTFNYGKWFAPVYLKRINLDTINLSNSLNQESSKQLQNIKASVFATVQEVNSSGSAYDQSVSSALSTVQNIRNALTGTVQASITNLNNTYSTVSSEINTMMASSTAYLDMMSSDASQISIFANNIIPTSMALSDVVSIIKNTLNGLPSSTQNGVFYDVFGYITTVKNWISISSKYAYFSSITPDVQKILDNLEYIQSNQSLIAAHLNSNAISNAQMTLPFILSKLKSGLDMSLPVLQNYESNAQKYSIISAELPKLNASLPLISEEIIPLQNELNSINLNLSIASLYFETEFSSMKLKDEQKDIDSFENASTFLTDLNGYYGDLQNANVYKSLPAMPSSSRYDVFFNTQKLMNTVTLTLQTVKALNALNDQYSYYISTLQKRSGAYININLLGFPLSVNEINTINNLYQNQYVSEVAPALGIISRRTHELASLSYFKDVSGRLNSINNTAYYITQDWQVKYLPPFMRWLFNSIMVAGIAAVITVLLSALMAYPFSRLRFVGRKYGLIGILLVQMFPTMMAMVALYLLLNFIGKFVPFLGLNTLGGLSFLYIGGGIAFNSWLIKGFFDTIPMELEEAAMVDGATRFQTFWRIILPLSAPVLAVTVILSFIGNYGDYILASIVLTGINNYTFAVGLQTFATSQYSTNWGLMTTAALIGMLPILALFLSLQRFIVGGLTQGSVKG